MRPGQKLEHIGLILERIDLKFVPPIFFQLLLILNFESIKNKHKNRFD